MAYAVSIRDQGPDKGRLSLGIRGNLKILHESLKLGPDFDDTGQATTLGAQFGLYYQRNALVASISYAPAFPFEGAKEWTAVDDGGTNLDSSGDIVGRIGFSIDGNSPFVNRYPAQLVAGLLLGEPGLT